MIMQKSLWYSLVCTALLFLGGCGSMPEKSTVGYEPVMPPAAPPQELRNGSIYQAGYDMVLFEDLRARRVGDILRVLLVEQMDAAKSSATNVDKSTSNSMPNPTLFGKQRTFGSNDLSSEIASDHEFSGEGDSNQSNKLRGSVTVTVAQVLPNGNLVVQGEKWIQINQGSEYVRLRGIVRPTDIGADNTVPSTQVADARISYGGTGAISEANMVGWLARFFMSPLWPF